MQVRYKFAVEIDIQIVLAWVSTDLNSMENDWDMILCDLYNNAKEYATVPELKEAIKSA